MVNLIGILALAARGVHLPSPSPIELSARRRWAISCSADLALHSALSRRSLLSGNARVRPSIVLILIPIGVVLSLLKEASN